MSGAGRLPDHRERDYPGLDELTCQYPRRLLEPKKCTSVDGISYVFRTPRRTPDYREIEVADVRK